MIEKETLELLKNQNWEDILLKLETHASIKYIKTILSDISCATIVPEILKTGAKSGKTWTLTESHKLLLGNKMCCFYCIYGKIVFMIVGQKLIRQ